MPSAGPRPRRILVALAIVGCTLLGACGDDDSEPAGKRGAAGEQTPLSPLTGLPLMGKAPKHPVVAVKIDNSSNSAPQVGLGTADMVVEELVEGGITRLAVFYYGDIPETVGPVRSMRATDIGIVLPLDAVLVASGGAAPTVARVDDAGIQTFTEGEAGFYREESRYAPYNLFNRLPELVKTLEPAKTPPTYLPFGSGKELGKGEPAGSLTASFSPSSATTFEYRDGRYVNTDTYAGAEDQFYAETVLVLRVRVGDAGYLDPAGNPVPETIFEGEGDAMIFNDGRMVRGTWTKPGLDSVVKLRSGGTALTLPPGKVWLELVPADGGSVTVGK
jgi:hypothetical protein